MPGSVDFTRLENKQKILSEYTQTKCFIFRRCQFCKPDEAHTEQALIIYQNIDPRVSNIASSLTRHAVT